MTPATSCGNRAHGSVRGLHWLMALAIAAAWLLIYSKGLLPKGGLAREAVKQAHMLAGLMILPLLPLRLLALARSPLPAIHPLPASWQESLAKALHVMLYAGMIALPVLGILFVQAQGKPVGIGDFSLPQMIQIDRALSRTLKKIHETLGLGMLYLVALHAGAALWHHYVQRDDALRRML